MTIRRKLYLFTGVLFFVFCSNSYLISQNPFSKELRNDSLLVTYPIFRYFNIDYKKSYNSSVFLYPQQKDLPFFCKIEYLLELSAQLPIKIRLGDLNYVNSLENK